MVPGEECDRKPVNKFFELSIFRCRCEGLTKDLIISVSKHSLPVFADELVWEISSKSFILTDNV
jgi:hypothetical protein